MFRLNTNLNRSGKAGGSPAAPSTTLKGCEIPTISEESLVDVSGDVYLFSWGMPGIYFITPQQYLDGVESFDTGNMNSGVYAMVCHSDPGMPGIQVVHYLMRVHGMSAPAQGANGDQYRSMYAELISCPGGGGIYDNIYMALYVRVPANGTPLPDGDIKFRPSYDKFYWPHEGAAYSLKWTCSPGENKLTCSLVGGDMYYDYKAVMLDAENVAPQQLADGCYLLTQASVNGSTYMLACRLFSLVAATTPTAEGTNTLYWLGLHRAAGQNVLGMMYYADDAASTPADMLGGPLKLISYHVFTNVETTPGA